MRGRVTFSAGGQERVLQFTTNRLCDLEEATGKAVLVFAEDFAKPGGLAIKDLRLLMRTGLDGMQSDADVGNLIDEIGMKSAAELVARAFNAAFDVESPEKSGAPRTGDLGKPIAGAA